MSALLARGARVPMAFVGAVRRYGLGHVVTFCLSVLGKRGPWGAIRYALLTSEQRRDAAAVLTPTLPNTELAGRDQRQEVSGLELDRRYAMPMVRWRERIEQAQREKLEGAPATPAKLFELGVVIRPGPGRTTDDLSRTIQSLSQLDLRPLDGTLRVFIVAAPWPGPLAPADLMFVSRPEELARGDNAWLLYLQAGDVLAPHFLHAVTPSMTEFAPAVITFDMVYEEDGLAFPLFLPGANPVLAKTLDYCFSRLALRAYMLPSGADSVTECPHAQLVRWLADQTSPDARSRWTHVFEPLIDARLNRREIDVQIAEIGPPASPRRGGKDRVSVVICTKDKGHLLRQLVRALLAFEDARIADVVIVSNNTTNPNALKTLKDLEHSPKVKIVRHDAPFNFSLLSNMGARLAEGDYLLFLNDDITPVSDEWLGTLLAAFDLDPAVGIVGPLLLYPDERVQHAGMYVGYRGSAGHTLRFAQLPEDEYLYYASSPREVSALTGAVMLMSRVCFEALGGFDELLATYLQDVDLSLRAKRSGFVCVLEPRSILIHMESASIKALVEKESALRQRHHELQYFLQRWGDVVVQDDLHSSGFHLGDETLRKLS